MNNVRKAFVAGQKRRLSDSERKPPDTQVQLEEQPEPKQRKTEPPPSSPAPQSQLQQSSASQHNLLSICDELLYEIFKYLDSSSIMAVMHCSPRFELLLLDHRFWHNIDLSNAPLPMGILEEILGRATEKTHTIKICGPPSSQHVAGEFKQFTCTLTSVFPKVATHLKILELQGVSLDFEYIHISEFPASLKRLTLKDCSVKVGDHVKSIFHSIEKRLVNLEDLSIEDNNWFEPYYIMALSKLPALRRLSLKGCQMMCKFVPYGSMAARFGFQKLEVLDLRLTPINNSDLQCFSAIETLRVLLLESPPNLPQEMVTPPKTSNGNEDTNATQPDTIKMLSDDEPSTSRAAMEHLRACKLAESGKEHKTDVAPAPATSDTTLPSDNCNGKKEASENSSTSKCTGRSSSDSDDEATSSTSASSSDKSDGTEANVPIVPPLVVIALPSVARERPDMPQAENAGNNDEHPEPVPAAAAGADGAEGPRAYIYVQNGGDGQRHCAFVEQMVDQLQTLRSNQPAHARFLPRPDQVIYMNPQAVSVAEPLLVMHSRRHRIQPRFNFDQVVQHPMFWNMLDPLDRDYARRLRSRQPTSPTTTHYFVSDRAIYSFGRAASPVQPDVVWIRNSNRSPNNRLERISLRNYPHITNYTLEHLVQCSPNLIYIDVSGTGITMLGLVNFKNQKPNCEVIATHLTKSDVDTETESETELNLEAQQVELHEQENELLADVEQQVPSKNRNFNNDEPQQQQPQAQHDDQP